MQATYKNISALITGGAGFIGSHIAEKLVEQGANVTVIDNLLSGRLENLSKVFNKINFIKDDIRSSSACEKATINQNIIFHCAALVSVQQSNENPKLCYEINVEGTKNLLSAAKNNNISNFILSSSAAVYGERQTACSETDTPNPKSPYAESKLVCEKLCFEFSKKYKLSSVILRYFNVYGERQNPDGEYASVVANFKSKILNNIPLTIFGTGKQTRDFINVLDVAVANLLLGKQNFFGEIFNIATGKCINLFELIEILKKELKVNEAKIEFKPERTGDIFSSKADATKYQEFKMNQEILIKKSSIFSNKLIS